MNNSHEARFHFYHRAKKSWALGRVWELLGPIVDVIDITRHFAAPHPMSNMPRHTEMPINITDIDDRPKEFPNTT